MENLDTVNHVVSGDLNMGDGLDLGVLGEGVDVTPPKNYGARPVKNDVGALVAIIFGTDTDLVGDAEQIAEAIVQYQRNGTVAQGFSRARLERLTLSWVDVPAVVPVASRSLPDDNRMSSSFYANIPSLENVSGLFFSSSANINYLLDQGIDLDSAEAQGYGLYVPFSTCPRGA